MVLELTFTAYFHPEKFLLGCKDFIVVSHRFLGGLDINFACFKKEPFFVLSCGDIYNTSVFGHSRWQIKLSRVLSSQWLVATY